MEEIAKAKREGAQHRQHFWSNNLLFKMKILVYGLNYELVRLTSAAPSIPPSIPIYRAHPTL